MTRTLTSLVAFLAFHLRLKFRLRQRLQHKAGFGKFFRGWDQLGQVTHVLLGSDDGFGDLTALGRFAHGLGDLGGLLAGSHDAVS